MLHRKTRLITAFLTIAVFFAVQVSCRKEAPSDLSKENIIPRPVTVSASGEYFVIKPTTVIYVSEGSEELMRIGNYLAERLRPATGYAFNVQATAKEPSKDAVFLTLAGNGGDPSYEGYDMLITKQLIRISAPNPAGVFYGAQTLRQLLPASIELSTVQEGPWKVATGAIADFPSYSHRGAMLDVSRHFFGVDDVKRFADFLAYYKMNRLHLHLSDDQGWRIEIKSWPNLTLIGGSTQVGGGPGGYYTQEQYADIVKYAQERYITVIPEIDMPGHTNAALASYPELNCNGKATKLYTGTNVGFSTLCTKSEITYKFIDDVIRELAAMTPGQWIHIGGDESHATKKEDYIPFINRVQDIVNSHGKTVIGWDEITLASLKSTSIPQYWASAENAKNAVAQGVKLLMSPASRAYIDMKYNDSTKLGLKWAGLIEVDKGYNWDPATLEPGIVKDNIIGIEAPLWSETVTNIDEIEYMVFPRLPGYAEIGWTPAEMRSWDEYRTRLGHHGPRFRAMNINFYESPLVDWK